MHRRPVLAVALVAAVALAPWAHAADPQVTDLAGDANFLNDQQEDTGAPESTTSPAGSQDYADVVSVLWENAKDGFKVTATLTGAPTPPAGTTLVYRMLGTTPICEWFGVAYYTTKGSDPTQPQSAIRDNCNETPTRLTEIALPVIKDNTITWTVPYSKIPADTKVTPGSTLTDLRFEVREIEDFGGQCIPAGVPSLGGACGLGYGLIDQATTTNTFKI